MAKKLLILVFLVVIATPFILANDGESVQCPLSHGKKNTIRSHFFNSPQSVPSLQTLCPRFASLSCCKESYGDQIRNNTDVLGTQYYNFLKPQSIPPACKSTFRKAQCLLCSPAQDAFVSVHDYGNTLRLCDTFCDRLFDDCKDAIIAATNMSVDETFTRHSDPGDYFCHALFKGLGWAIDVIKGDYCVIDQPCTPDDYQGVYTPCQGGFRSAVFSRKPGVKCVGGTPQPEPIVGLPCHIPCGEGTYLPIGSTACEQCPAGSISSGDSKRIENWTTQPQGLSTYCTQLDENSEPVFFEGCGWNWAGGYSSANSQTSNINITLEWTLTLIKATGSVQFRVDMPVSEHESLYFSIDNNVYKITTAGYQIMTYTITQGLHTLRWTYTKDASAEDEVAEARLSYIEVIGSEIASDSCSKCLPGQYQNEAGKSICKECPSNTFSGSYGATSCAPCPPDQYSFGGSSICHARLQCNETDQITTFGPCTADGKREMFYNWTQPVICDYQHTLLPATREEDCRPCPDGTRREDGKCVGCAIGQYRGENGACTVCPAGNFASPYVIFNSFDSTWKKQNFTSSCQGQCGDAMGWRNVEDTLDSGVLHGPRVKSLLQYGPIQLEANATISFDYTLFCTKDEINGSYPCNVYFIAWSLSSEYQFLKSYSIPKNESSQHGERVTVQIAHSSSSDFELMWIFQKTSSVNERNYDRVTLRSLSIQTPSAPATAIECAPCDPGYEAAAGSTKCVACKAGFYSSANNSVCLPCPENTFSSIASSFCTPCGAGTVSNADKTGCVDTCAYQIGQYSYNITALKRKDYYGPIYDQRGERYFLSACGVPANATACTYDGSLVSSICQVQQNLRINNLGSFISYGRNESVAENEGFIVTYSNGGLCRSGPRETTINFLCDSSVSIGNPQAVEPVEQPNCHYRFFWRTIYACPLCTEQSYYYEYDACIAGKTNKRYKWKSPKMCHDGVPLPPAELGIDCEETTSICGAGLYFDIGAKLCKICPAGSFCVDGGVTFNQWDPFPDNFTAIDIETTKEYVIVSQELSRQITLKRPGNVTTTYIAYGSVSLIVDGNVVEDNIPAGVEKGVLTHVRALTAGEHFVTWKVNNELSSLAIKSVSFTGIENSIIHPSECPSGTISTEGSSECTTCPANTRPNAQKSGCEPCLADFYSIPGWSDCKPTPPCTNEDWQLSYSTAPNGQRTVVYQKISNCRYIPFSVGSMPSRPLNGSISGVAAYCDPGYSRNGSSCIPCEVGQYYDFEDGVCNLLQPGYTAERKVSYFRPLQSLLDFPEGFTAGCDGVGCSQPSGWRVRSNATDSGVTEEGYSNSWLSYSTSLIDYGTISFRFSGNGDCDEMGLQFFIDNEQQIFRKLRQCSFTSNQLTPGQHTFVWNFAAVSPTNGNVSVSNIIITQDIRGATVAPKACGKGTYAGASTVNCIECPPGTYSGKEASTSCTRCPKTKYADSPGSSSCNSCPTDTTSENTDGTYCIAPHCTFNGVDSYGAARTFSLQPLAGIRTVVLSNGQLLLFDICDRLPYNLSQPSSSSKRGSFIVDLAHQELSYGDFIEDPETKKGKPLRLRYTSTPPSTTKCKTITTTFNFNCVEQNATDPLPKLKSSSSCALELEWNTYYACPVCRVGSDDYVSQSSDCVDGQQTISEVRVALCNGPAVANQRTDPCSVKFSFPVFALVAVAVIFALLALAAILVYIRYRTLTNKYSLLVEEKSKNLEMNELASNSSSQSTEEITIQAN